MKKVNISIVTVLLVVLSSCRMPESAEEKPTEIVTTGSAFYYDVSVVDYYASGMHYKVFNSVKGSVFVVNVTKDSLDIANFNIR